MRWLWPLLAVFIFLGFSAFVVGFFSTVVSIQAMTAVWRSIMQAPLPPPPAPFMMVETGFIVLVVIVLAALMAFTVFMVSRPPSREMVGAIALTLASVVLISGVWCMALSPISDYTQFKDRYEYSLSIGGLESRSVTFMAEKGETLDISVGLTVKGEVFSVFDPDGEMIWQDLNGKDSHFRTQALKSGTYKVEVKNPTPDAITCPIYISRTVRVTVRPLEPAGQWLSLISLPIFGLGIWASGIHTTIRKRIST